MVKQICLFDVDGTITQPGQCIDDQMIRYLSDLREKVPVALVCGSSINKLITQMKSANIQELINRYDYIFAENGLVAYMGSCHPKEQNIIDHIGEELVQEFINFSLFYMSKLHLPFKRGTFVDVRTGLLNICPVGRSCNIQERNQFALFDQEQNILKDFIAAMQKRFPFDKYGLNFSIGGQISINVYPSGWDKTFCLQYLNQFDRIDFFGNKTEPGGSDYDLFVHPRIFGHSVSSPDQTRLILDQNSIFQ